MEQEKKENNIDNWADFLGEEKKISEKNNVTIICFCKQSICMSV